MKKFLTGVAVVVGLFATPISVLAAPPVADPTVAAAAQDAVLGLQQAATSNLGTVIPIAAVLLISVAIVYFLIRHFRGMARV